MLLDILSKPSDRLLLDAGITREEAVHIIGSHKTWLWWNVPEPLDRKDHFEWSASAYPRNVLY